MDIHSLKAGFWYQFDHKRKGTFYAIFRAIVPGGPGDEADPEMLLVDICTQDGSGQERFANAFTHISGQKRRPALSDRILRPSQVNSISMPNTHEQRRLKELVLEDAKAVAPPKVATDHESQPQIAPERKRPWWKRLSGGE